METEYGSRQKYPPLPLTYSLGPVANAVWKESRYQGLRARDLGMASASKTQMDAIELRADTDGAFDKWVGADGSTLHMLFLLDGTISFTMPNGEVVDLNKGDVVHRTFLNAAEAVRYQAGFAALELTAPAIGASAGQLDQMLKIEPKAHSGSWQDEVYREAEEAYIKGDGPRKFFLYRDLGGAEQSAQRVHIQIVRATEKSPAGGTGWHIHSMSQLVLVLRGEAQISVQGAGELMFRSGDVMTLGADTGHDVSAFSEDYLVVELCLPGDYDTASSDAP